MIQAIALAFACCIILISFLTVIATFFLGDPDDLDTRPGPQCKFPK